MASGDTRKVILKNTDGEILIPYTEVASSTTAGRVKPDGTTTTVDANGVISVTGKQDTLVSGTNIKTINGLSVLGSGDLSVTAQAAWGSITGTLSNQADLQNALNAKANDSAVVKLTGNQTIAGNKDFTSKVKSVSASASDASTGRFIAQSLRYTLGTTPSAVIYNQYQLTDSNGDWTGLFHNIYYTNGRIETAMAVHKQDKSASTGIAIGYDNNGNVYTYAPTPATADNSTKIATTAFVNNKLGANFKVVTALPASPTAGVFYFVKE